MLPALHVGRRVRVLRSDFDTLVARNYNGAASQVAASEAQAFWEGRHHPAPVVPPVD